MSGRDDAHLTSRASRDPLALVAFLGVLFFAVVGIGGPLWGDGVFAGTDELVTSGPYRDAGFAGGAVANTYTDDTYDTIIPNTLLFADELRAGELAAWNPYVLGGVPLGATPNFALASPLTLPYYVLPGASAPGVVKLLEIAVAAGGTFLFLRRLRLPPAAAWVGGLVFASSAFLVAWTNWPQTRTAAVIPLVFWALERIVQRRRSLDAVLLALAVAAMFLGGFPAITGYTLLVGGAYLVVRALAERSAGWWDTVRVAVLAGAGVLGGIGLAAFQLVPFASFLSGALVEGRAQTPADHLPVSALLTALAPWALGTVEPARPPSFALDTNMIEALSYVGAAALLLVLVAIVAPVTLPRGVRAFAVVATGVGVLVTYLGGPPLAVLQLLPVLFADNDVGRLRSVLGFLVAVLAAVGAAALLRAESWGPSRRRTALATGCAVVATAGGVGVWVLARTAARSAGVDAADAAERVRLLDRHTVVGLGFLAVALVAAAALRWASRTGPPRSRLLRPLAVRAVAGTVLVALVAGQALLLVREFWPRSDRATFYPVTDVQRFLAGALGAERYAFATGAMATGADAPLRLRALGGHTFVDARFARLIEALPGDQFSVPATLPVLGSGPDTARSPVLDRLGVRYFVTAPDDVPFGTVTRAPSGGSVALPAGTPVEIGLPAGPGLRAVGLAPVAAVPPGTRLDVVVRDRQGRVIGGGGRELRDPRVGEPAFVPVTLDAAGVAATATVTSTRPLTVDAAGPVPALSTVAAVDDGLRLAHAGAAVAWERTTALPRIRWASAAVVEPDPERRVDALTAGVVPRDTVLLDAPGAPVTGGPPARLEVVRDGSDGIEVAVVARAAGHLVVADALQQGWAAEVDGVDAPLVAADHGLAAVAVGPGEHVVRLSYRSPDGGLGLLVTAVSAVVALAVLAAAVARCRRTARSRL